MTTSISTIDAKEEFSEIVSRVTSQHERIILTRRGKEIAAIVPINDFHKLLASQDKRDHKDAVESLQEARVHGTITLDELRKKVG